MDQVSSDFGSSENATIASEIPDRTEAHAGERRHSFRVHVPGRASIWRTNQLRGHYTVHDLCLEGCLLRGHPSGSPGDRVELVLHLPDMPPLWLTAQVRRCQADGMALRFEHTPPRIEDRLQDLIIETYTRMHADSASFSLVIEPRAAVRHALVRHLDDLGQRAVGVATPLDAVQLLLERGERVLTAFISQRSPAPGFELVEFLERNYPRVRRVLMGNSEALTEAWLLEATGEVHALLETPCSEEAVRKVVHRIAALPQ